MTSTYTYDRRGREKAADYGNGVTVEYDYGYQADWTTASGPTIGSISRSTDAGGNLTGWTLANGSQVSFSYDRGRLDTQTDELGRQTQYEYDELGRVSSTTDLATGAETSYVYDKSGRLLSETTRKEQRHTTTTAPCSRSPMVGAIPSATSAACPRPRFATR